jgi:inner membrane protease ATP23
VSLNASFYIERQKMIERFNRYAKYEATNHLRRFMQADKFWTTMSNALIAHDRILKQQTVDLVLCDHFMEGAYIPADNKIMLCSNVLVKRRDFDNAMKRMLIKMYDHARSDNYKPDNCKHLACTEVRAALFHSQCNPKERSRMKLLKNSSKAKEKLLANEFCVRELAIEHLKERSKCEPKADRYVDYIFEKCKNDTAPINSSRANKLRSLTQIM